MPNTAAAGAQWNPRFCALSPAFAALEGTARLAANWRNWPSLTAYDAILNAAETPIVSGAGVPLRTVAQPHARDKSLPNHYEARIYQRGELPTRQDNWHDFFNLLVWRMLPHSKAALNRLHYRALVKRHHDGNGERARSPQEHAATLLDENGAVIVTSNPQFLDLIRRFRWKTLFWTHREAVIEELRCTVFGHALYEKALTPYVGMTAHAILLLAPEEHVRAPAEVFAPWIDQQLSRYLDIPGNLLTPQQLQPFPLLGMPGWDRSNGCETYYDNTQYFRPGRGGANAD
jgi:hypothetical protein